MYFPLASPMQYTCGTTAPFVSSTCILSLTGMKPRLSVSALIDPRLRPEVKGALVHGKRGENQMGSRLEWGHAWCRMEGLSLCPAHLPVATMTASTSSVSTTFLVLKSVSSMVTGVTPGTPGVTLVAMTPVW